MVDDKRYYQRITGQARAACLSGKFFSSLFAQSISLINGSVPYVTLVYLSIFGKHVVEIRVCTVNRSTTTTTTIKHNKTTTDLIRYVVPRHVFLRRLGIHNAVRRRQRLFSQRETRTGQSVDFVKRAFVVHFERRANACSRGTSTNRVERQSNSKSSTFRKRVKYVARCGRLQFVDNTTVIRCTGVPTN